MTVLEGYPTPSEIFDADPWSSYSEDEEEAGEEEEEELS